MAVLVGIKKGVDCRVSLLMKLFRLSSGDGCGSWLCCDLLELT